MQLREINRKTYFKGTKLGLWINIFSASVPLAGIGVGVYI
jgi:hypothetical protein